MDWLLKAKSDRTFGHRTCDCPLAILYNELIPGHRHYVHSVYVTQCGDGWVSSTSAPNDFMNERSTEFRLPYWACRFVSLWDMDRSYARMPGAFKEGNKTLSDAIRVMKLVIQYDMGGKL
jgi:hypothetical protein